MKFEEIKIGAKASSVNLVTDEKIKIFAEISGDDNPIHLDDEFAKNSIFKKRIAHGLYVSSYISALIANKLPGRGTIYINQNLNFLAPVFIDDRITTELEVMRIKEEKRIVFLNTKCFNQDGKLVIDGTAIVKVPN